MPTNTNDVALYILKALKQEGINYIFLVPGYNIDPLVEQFSKAGIKAIVAAHEGGAAYMADGYARARKSFGVCMATGSPGVTNMVTAITAAYLDRSPVLVISGSLPSNWDGDGSFQDSNSTGIDDCEIMRPITVWSQRIPLVYEKDKNTNDCFKPSYEKARDFLQKAIRAMRGVENRPAFLTVPRNILKGKYDADYQPLNIKEPARAIDREAMPKVPDILASATRIVIFAGNGSVWSDASEEIREFAEKFSIPVVTTMRAKGAISEDSPMSFGFFGIGGTLQANKLIIGSEEAEIEKAEVLLVLGATLNENNTLAWNKAFPLCKSIVRVDINPNIVVSKNYQETLIVGDVREFFSWLGDHEDRFARQLYESQEQRKNWLQEIRNTPYYENEENRTSNETPIHPAQLVAELRQVAPHNTVMVLDSGSLSYHVPHHWTSYAPNEFLILTNTGPMGYGVAMGIGNKVARPDRPCVVVVGDGGLMMHGMEIKTAVRNQIKLVIVVINNSALGNVYLRALREDWPDEAVDLTKIEPTINGAAFARSLGAEARVVEQPERLATTFKEAFASTDPIPFVIDVRCCRKCEVPNDPYGNSDASDDMESLGCRH